MSPALRIGATGFSLIAVCYGFARFAFGLFLPQIDADLGLGPSLSGLISGGSFAGYCIAIVASAVLTERRGARAVAVGAAYNFARRLKTLSGLTPYEYVCKVWTSEPDRFIVDPIHQMPGLNT